MAHIDPDVFQSLKDLGDDDFIEEMINTFESQMETNLPALETSASRGEWRAMALILSQVRSAAGNLGALSFSDLCGRVEEDVLSAQKPKELSEFLSQYREVAKELRTIVPKRP